MRNWVIVAGILIASAAQAAPSPKEVVQEIFAGASEAEVAKDSAKREAVNAKVDFDALANAALGKNAASVPAAERSWFRNTLKEIISRTVYPKAPGFLSGVKISYSKVQENGAKASVASTVQNKADLTDVSYTLAQKSGDWKVVDVAISGLSWVDSIRDQVDTTLKNKKWAGLKALMNKRLATLKAGKA